MAVPYTVTAFQVQLLWQVTNYKLQNVLNFLKPPGSGTVYFCLIWSGLDLLRKYTYSIIYNYYVTFYKSKNVNLIICKKVGYQKQHSKWMKYSAISNAIQLRNGSNTHRYLCARWFNSLNVYLTNHNQPVTFYLLK